MDFLISVIVPIYNTPESQLKRCINSILSQTYKNFEILLVDDGSNNMTRYLVDEIGKYDGRIRVFHTENRGASHARNYGVRAAMGDYIMFSDSDDYVSPFMIEQAVEIVNKFDADIVYGAVLRTYQINNGEFAKLKPQSIEVLDKEGRENLRKHLLNNSVNKFIFPDGSRIHRGPYARMVRANIARQVFFPEEFKWCEDVIWNQRLLDKVNTISITNSIWYYYVQNQGSLMYGYDPTFYSNTRDAIKLLKNETLSKFPQLYESYDEFLLEQMLINIMHVYLFHKDNRESVLKKNREFKQIMNEEPFNRLKKCPIYNNMKLDSKIALISFRVPMIFFLYYIYSYIKPIIRFGKRLNI